MCGSRAVARLRNYQHIRINIWGQTGLTLQSVPSMLHVHPLFDVVVVQDWLTTWYCGDPEGYPSTPKDTVAPLTLMPELSRLVNIELLNTHFQFLQAEVTHACASKVSQFSSAGAGQLFTDSESVVQAFAFVIELSNGSGAEDAGAKTFSALVMRASPLTGTTAEKFALLSVTVMKSFEACKPTGQLLTIETPMLLPFPDEPGAVVVIVPNWLSHVSQSAQSVGLVPMYSYSHILNPTRLGWL